MRQFVRVRTGQQAVHRSRSKRALGAVANTPSEQAAAAAAARALLTWLYGAADARPASRWQGGTEGEAEKWRKKERAQVAGAEGAIKIPDTSAASKPRVVRGRKVVLEMSVHGRLTRVLDK